MPAKYVQAYVHPIHMGFFLDFELNVIQIEYVYVPVCARLNFGATPAVKNSYLDATTQSFMDESLSLGLVVHLIEK